MSGSAIDEVRRQHVFIESWLSGAEVADDGWPLFEATLADGFEIVAPTGVITAKPDLLEGFGTARGAMPDVQIEIRNAALLYTTDDLAVVRYEEWQLHESLANQRVSTVVFTKEASTPLGWSWLTLHETALPEPN